MTMDGTHIQQEANQLNIITQRGLDRENWVVICCDKSLEISISFISRI
jgi:hypothetical protein